MSFDWKNYLLLANELATWQGDKKLDEAARRSAISRYYYGVFCLASDRLKLKRSITIPQKNSHKFVIDEYKKGNNIELAIGGDLDRLKHERVEADYKNLINTTNNKVELAKILSQKILLNLEKLP